MAASRRAQVSRVFYLTQSPAKEAQGLLRGRWEIDNRLFHVKDEGFGEDRQMLQQHHSRMVVSLLRNTAMTLLRGRCRL